MVTVIHTDCFTALASAFKQFYGNESFLPNLTVLTATGVKSWSILYALSPKLKSFSLKPLEDDVRTSTTLASLATVASSLETVHVDGAMHIDLNGHPLSASVPAMTNLRSFTCGHFITGRALAHLASLPQLHTFTCRIANWDTNAVDLSKEYASLDIPSRPFQSLRKLHIISVAGCSVINPFLQNFIRSSPLERLELEAYGRDVNWTGSFDQLEILAANNSIADLVDVKIIWANAEGEGKEAEEAFEHWKLDLYKIMPRHLRPLLSCHGLEKLHVMLPGSWDLFDDDAFEAMADAWPNMRSLWLAPYRGYLGGGQTLKSLLHLARGCPRMEHLRLVFSSLKDVAGHENSDGATVVEHKLAYFNVGRSPLESSAAMAVASSIYAAFPNLHMLDNDFGDPDIDEAIEMVAGAPWVEVQSAYSEIWRSHHQRILFGAPTAPWDPAPWAAVDDRLRGGASTSHLRLAPRGVRFHGVLDTHALGGAGFASRAYRRALPLDPGEYDGLALAYWPQPAPAPADAPTRFTLVLKTAHASTRPDGRRESTVSYEYTFDARPAAAACAPVELRIPFRDFEATYRGRAQPGAPPLDPAQIREVAIMCRSGFGRQCGAFALDIQWIGAIRSRGVGGERGDSEKSPLVGRGGAGWQGGSVGVLARLASIVCGLCG
ncbi:hypothetical protein HWV62_37926 [Athelia sp. TMB]|nr:hypothetical protein HWV62_37926 [Athelia sp. TMB]